MAEVKKAAVEKVEVKRAVVERVEVKRDTFEWADVEMDEVRVAPGEKSARLTSAVQMSIEQVSSEPGSLAPRSTGTWLR
jgi:hypothetical protein